ncbi:hypothetical protein ACKFKG_06105 [Phormidesmis sp. 146-35]
MMNSMVALWERFFPKQSNRAEQAAEEQQLTPESLSDRLEIYKQFNLEIKEERGGYGDSRFYRPAPRTRYIQRYF